ncbi:MULTISPECIES: glycosyltransferase family 2 protein [unclassified Cryobacterium]|uniref:glycosyltransferase family 2 protein n=1 Tax=unclassified Cryobacterium TaxID=2649013 RepID=UPI001F5466DC|nr:MULTISPECIES: glycosyltransferase family 2 protein [unclassified Cryobacterium]
MIPAFNNVEYIRAAVESVLGQTHADLEVIVADHGSTDGTWECLQDFLSDDRVTLLQTPAGGSAIRNWNRVTECASGEFIKLVCGDDILYPRCIEVQLQAFAEGIALVASPRDIIDARGDLVLRRWGIRGKRRRMSGATAIRQVVRAGTNIFGEPASVLMRRSTLFASGLWQSERPYLIDEATYVNVLQHGDFALVPESLSAFRMSTSQWSVKLAKEQSDQALAFHRSLLKSRPDILTRRDVRLGNVRARQMALMRRVSYVWLKNRMSREET